MNVPDGARAARTVVAILDRDSWNANTDIIVIVDGAHQHLTWVPRDLWSPSLGDRVNAAFKLGGLVGLLRALDELGFPCDGALCIRRGASEAALANADVTVPVRKRLAYWYPLKPDLPIEEGRKRVTFEPPAERLTGERVHQWLGARRALDGSASEFPRLRRQHVFLRALLRSGFDFRAVLSDPQRVVMEGVDPLGPLTGVAAGWRMTVFRGLYPARRDGQAVLIRAPLPERLLRLARRVPKKVRELLSRTPPA